MCMNRVQSLPQLAALILWLKSQVHALVLAETLESVGVFAAFENPDACG